MIKFEYNGIRSDDKGIIVTQIEQNDTIVSRSPITGEKNKYRPRENHFGMVYDDNLSFVMHVIKDPCKNKETKPELIGGILVYPELPTIIDGILKFPHNTPYIEDGILITPEYSDYFTSNEVREITSWLTSPNFPKLFRFIDNNYYCEPIDFFAVITEVSCEHTNKPDELIYTVQCDSPYGYTPEKSVSITSISTLDTPLNIYSDTDNLEDYVYPVIKVHPSSNGSVTIRNVTDDGELNIQVVKNADFYIDCNKLKMYDVLGDILSFDDLGISDIDNIYFPRLCAGENILEFKGNAEIEITYREPRKVGAFA